MEKQRETVFIKNMVCPRCISAVESILSGIGISFSEIRLGEADLLSNITESQRFELESKLIAAGFDLLKSRDDQVCDQVKTFLLQTVNQLDSNPLSQNISDLLTFHFSMSYSRLTQLFSKHENITIEKYFIAQKVEKVKELLVYDELSLSEIAFRLNYSSVAYLSNQFKKVTGLTPSYFKKIREDKRKPLDEV